MAKDKPYTNPPRDPNWTGAPPLGKQRDYNKDARTQYQENRDNEDSAVKKTRGSSMPTSSRIKESKDNIVRTPRRIIT
jgi:hypothetical protein